MAITPESSRSVIGISRKELAGYDVAYVYQLARDLNVRLRLIPLNGRTLLRTENFASYWLNLKRTDGFEARQRAYWVERIPRARSDAPLVHSEKRLGGRAYGSGFRHARCSGRRHVTLALMRAGSRVYRSAIE